MEFRKKLVDKLVEECIETNYKVKLAKVTLAKISINAVLAQCTLCYFY